MRPSALKYALVYLIPLVVGVSLASQDLWSFGAVAFVFGLLPTIELFLKPDPRNLDAAQESVAKQDRLYDLILYSLVPIQWGLLLFFLVQVSAAELSWEVKLGLTSAFGMACGVLGINAAHELGHRPTEHEQFMAKALLLSTLYMHFFIEHNRGHHRHVSTPEDPASAKMGESIWRFALREIIGSWISAWKLEVQRLRKKGLPVFSLHNEMLRFQVIQLALVVAIAFVFGPEVMAWFLGAALIGIVLLETVNYIEHYGLRRSRTDGRLEPFSVGHAWNADHALSNALLVNLQRHSDHHMHAWKPYPTLEPLPGPQLPTGYSGCVFLAWASPLWVRLMERRLTAAPCNLAPRSGS